MDQRTIARATIRNCRIVANEGRWIRVGETALLVRHSIQTYLQSRNESELIGLSVDVRIRHLVLDADSGDERWMWDAYVLGPAR